MKKILFIILVSAGLYYFFSKTPDLFSKYGLGHQKNKIESLSLPLTLKEQSLVQKQVSKKEIAQVQLSSENKVLSLEGDTMLLREKEGGGKDFIKPTLDQEIKEGDIIKIGEQSYLIFSYQKRLLIKVMSRSTLKLNSKGVVLDDGKIFFSLEEENQNKPINILSKRSEIILKDQVAAYLSVERQEDRVAVYKGILGVSPSYFINEKQGMIIGDLQKVIAKPGNHDFVDLLTWKNLSSGVLKADLFKSQKQEEIKKDNAPEGKNENNKDLGKIMTNGVSGFVEKATGIDEAKDGMKKHYDQMKDLDVQE